MPVRHLLACALAFGLYCSGTLAAQERRLTLDQALSEAQEKSPEIHFAEADLAIARADLTTAKIFPYNPEVGFSIGPSSNADTSLTSYQFGVSQTLELGGKRGHRTTAAQRRVEAAEARLARSREVVVSRVRHAFGLAWVARARAAAAAESDSVAALLRYAAQERLRLGAGTQLEVNVATAAAAREYRARLQAARDLNSASLQLGAAIGIPSSDQVVPEGDFPLAERPTRTESALVEQALNQRADLLALRAEVAAAEADVRLAGSLAWPDPTFGVSAGQEEDFQVLQFGVALPIPVWNRGQGVRAQATATLSQIRLAETVARRDAEREVREAYRGLETAIEAERAFDQQVVARLGENLALAEESFRAGKIGLLVFNQVRRDLVDARLAYLDAVTDVIERQTALELAIGGALTEPD